MHNPYQQHVNNRAILYFRKAGVHRAHREPALRAYAEKHGLTIVAVYAEDGVSGDRCALQQLRQAIVSPTRAFDTVLHYDAMAWGRFLNADESGYDDYLCHQYGIRVIYLYPPSTACALPHWELPMR